MGTAQGQAPVASRLAVRQRLTRPPLARDRWDRHTPAPSLQPLLALATDVALVGIDIAAGVAGFEHALEVQGAVPR